METEKQIERHLVMKIKKMGGKAYKFVSPGNTGVPDRVIILPVGKVLFVELKAEDGRLTPNQVQTIDEMRGLGAEVHVLYGQFAVELFLERCRDNMN